LSAALAGADAGFVTADAISAETRFTRCVGVAGDTIAERREASTIDANEARLARRLTAFDLIYATVSTWIVGIYLAVAAFATRIDSDFRGIDAREQSTPQRQHHRPPTSNPTQKDHGGDSTATAADARWPLLPRLHLNTKPLCQEMWDANRKALYPGFSQKP
jgi:hypothetical protein